MGRIRNLATNNFFLLLTFIGVCTLLIFAIIHFSNYKDVNNISIEYYHEKSELILTNKNISDPGDKKPKLHEEVLRKIEEFPKEELEIVVRVDGDEQINKVSKMIESLGGSVSDNFKIGDIVVAKLEANKIDELAKEREILEISPEIEYTIFLNESISAFEIDRIAWGNGISGKNVKIAIVDTGINSNHEMLSGKVMAAKSFVDSEDENDLNGHGTHCAGIAAGDGVLRGVAPKASLLNAKVLDKYGRGKSSQIIAGINWAVENGADIISMSFGSTTNDIDGSLASTIREAINRGVIFVAASGNCRTGCGGFYGVTMPGSMEEVITIGAINDNKNIAGFSSGQNFGSYIKPDFVEPGVGIISAYNDGNYKEMSGTSMSTPFAAGIIALVLDRYGKMNQTEIIKKLRDASDDLGDSGKDDKYGFGVINISKLFFASDGNNDDNEAGNNSNGWTNLSFSGLITKDIDDARFLYQKNFSVRVRNSIANSFVVYEFNSGIFSVEEIKFENAYFLADYLYSILPLSKRDELVIVNSKYSYIYFLDSYIWYNNYSVYIASFADFENISKYLDIYSMNTGNLVGRTFDENVENLKYFDDASIKYLSSLAKESLTNKNEEKNISAQWGGDTPST
ncbi:MAG: S8 family peptidase, partial [Candidatus Pacearchaeota archaeon]|nr:S8 family peptidase [Candidatus Pacearchaeota archaeon]